MVRLNSLPLKIRNQFKSVKKPSKFGNIRKICSQGHNHPSKMEAAHCEKLYLLLGHKECGFSEISYEPKYPLIVKGVIICTHKPDFLLHNKDGSLTIHEVKGKATPDWRIKHKLFMALYPSIEYIVIGLPKRKRKVAGVGQKIITESKVTAGTKVYKRGGGTSREGVGLGLAVPPH